MKHVVSVSLGSSTRDKVQETEFFGEPYLIERVGVNGSWKAYARKLEELDGRVDAIGIGGMDIYLWVRGRRYAFREGRAMVRRLKSTPWADGSGMKNTLERETVRRLQSRGDLVFRNRRALLVAGVDRFGMAEALHEAGADLALGDLAFALNIPYVIRSWRIFEALATLILPVAVQAPFEMLYPTGSKQETTTPRHARWYDWAEIIAGDYHLIRRFMPNDLRGKTILTNTIRTADRHDLEQRGVAALVTTTPSFGGESFGTNVMEAVIVAALGRPPDEIAPEEYLAMLERLGWEPRVQTLGA